MRVMTTASHFTEKNILLSFGSVVVIEEDF